MLLVAANGLRPAAHATSPTRPHRSDSYAIRRGRGRVRGISDAAAASIFFFFRLRCRTRFREIGTSRRPGTLHDTQASTPPYRFHSVIPDLLQTNSSPSSRRPFIVLVVFARVHF